MSVYSQFWFRTLFYRSNNQKKIENMLLFKKFKMTYFTVHVHMCMMKELNILNKNPISI